MKRLFFSILTFFLLYQQAYADWPEHPIRLIVPAQVGNSIDIIARFFATQLSEQLQQKVYIENKPGANHSIGTYSAIQADPDGYTFLWANTNFVLSPHILKSIKYSIDDLQPIGQISINRFVLVTTNKFDSFEQFLSEVKHNNWDWGAANYGSISHILGLQFEKKYNVKGMMIPFKSTTEATNEILAGRLHYAFMGVEISKPLAEAGKLKIYPEQTLLVWNGIFAPKNTPQPIIDKIATAITNIKNTDKFQQFIEQNDSIIGTNYTQQQFQTFVEQQYDYYGKLTQQLGIEKR